MTLAQDDNVIQAFTADRTDETLGVGVLPGLSRGSDDLCDAHRANAMTEWVVPDGVIASASGAGTRCDAIGQRLPA